MATVWVVSSGTGDDGNEVDLHAICLTKEDAERILREGVTKIAENVKILYASHWRGVSIEEIVERLLRNYDITEWEVNSWKVGFEV